MTNSVLKSQLKTDTGVDFWTNKFKLSIFKGGKILSMVTWTPYKQNAKHQESSLNRIIAKSKDDLIFAEHITLVSSYTSQHAVPESESFYMAPYNSMYINGLGNTLESLTSNSTTNATLFLSLSLIMEVTYKLMFVFRIKHKILH